MINIIASTVFWYLVESFVFNPFLGVTTQSVFGSLFSYDSFGFNFAADRILTSLPLLLGCTTGLLYYLYARRRETTLSAGLPMSHIASRRGTYATRIFCIYVVVAIATTYWLGFKSAASAQGMAVLVVPFIMVGALALLVALPTVIFIPIRAFLLYNRPAYATPLSPGERKVVWAVMAVSIICFVTYILVDSITSAQLPRSINLSDLLTNPAQYDNALVLASTEIAYGIKGQSGFAVRYSNYYDLKKEAGAHDYTWVDGDAIGSYQDPACAKPVNTATTLLVQWGLSESLAAFSKAYNVPPSDIRVYDCAGQFTIIGTFHAQLSGPGNNFPYSITATPGADYLTYLKTRGNPQNLTRTPLDTTTEPTIWKAYKSTADYYTLLYSPDWSVIESPNGPTFLTSSGTKAVVISATPLIWQGRSVTPQEYYNIRYGKMVAGSSMPKDKPLSSLIIVPGKEWDEVFFTNDTMYSFHVYDVPSYYPIIEPMIESFKLDDATERYIQVQTCITNCSVNGQ